MTLSRDAGDEVVLTATESPFTVDLETIPASELRRSFHRLVLLYHLGRQVCAESDEARVFETILSAVTRLLDAERGFVGVLERGRLVPRAVRRGESGDQSEAWPFSKTLLSRVLTEGVCVLTTDAQREAPYPSVAANGLRSVMCCPLGTAREAAGLIYVDNRALTGAFTRSDLQFLQALAQYASLAIVNAHACRALSAQRDSAEARLQALQRITQTPEIEFVGQSAAVSTLLDGVRRAARKDVSVILLGETGTGKELIARLLHASSSRAAGPFVALDLSNLSSTLVEAELFGHEKGAFTGATERRIGRLEMAQGGTLLIDEALNIPEDIQPKLLRVLEQRTFQRVGGREEIAFDARVIGAFNRDPLDAIKEGLFRDDLYYRMATVTLELPPLRERPEDVAPLLTHFLGRSDARKTFDDEALDLLCAYPWPGNVRELLQLCRGLDVMVEGPLVRASDLPPKIRRGAARHQAQPLPFEPLSDAVARLEREHFARALSVADGNNERALALLGVSRAKFFQRKKDFGL